MSKSDETLILEQVKGLKRRIKSAIKSGGSDILASSLAMEYANLLDKASLQSFLNDKLKLEFSSLKLEFTTILPKSQGDPLARLKWLDNSSSQLEMLVTRLVPTDTKPAFGLHPKVLDVSGKLFRDGHYEEAIFEAFKALEEYVKEKSGIKQKSGKSLIGYVFDENNPLLKIKYSHPDTAKEEQEGFKLIFMGSMLGIRNPKAHHRIIQQDKVRTMQYLALASLLFKTIDDATLVQNNR
jgi:uncharacterized protein (TIGR02391 family)